VRVALASLIGTSIEWYDFFLYGTAAALVFNKLFFPNFDPLIGTIAAFATFSVGFIARPIGGIVFGHYGDRIGRKKMLYITLLIMGLATALIGLLPTYNSIGIWAPILLVVLRLAQGFGLGGEWGGAVLMAVEHAPPNRRGFYGSWPQIGAYIGLLLSTLVFRYVSGMPEGDFLGWAWRVPFLLSFLLVVVGLYIRKKVSESPVFEKVKAQAKGEASLLQTRQPGLIWLAILLPLSLGHAAMYGPQASFFSELFPAHLRYSGASLGYQLASVFAGGLSPLIATALLAWGDGNPWPVSVYMIVLVLITVVSVGLTKETYKVGIGPEVARVPAVARAA